MLWLPFVVYTPHVSDRLVCFRFKAVVAFAYPRSATSSATIFIRSLEEGVRLFPSATFFVSTCASTHSRVTRPFQCASSINNPSQMPLSRWPAHFFQVRPCIMYVRAVSIIDCKCVSHRSVPCHCSSLRRNRRPSSNDKGSMRNEWISFTSTV
jgi:hypothetical protein